MGSNKIGSRNPSKKGKKLKKHPRSIGLGKDP
jgi:hypothetical protein